MVFNKDRNQSLNERIALFAGKLADLSAKHEALGVDAPHIAEKIAKLKEAFEAFRNEAARIEQQKAELLGSLVSCGINPFSLFEPEGQKTNNEIVDDLEIS